LKSGRRGIVPALNAGDSADEFLAESLDIRSEIIHDLIRAVPDPAGPDSARDPGRSRVSAFAVDGGIERAPRLQRGLALTEYFALDLVGVRRGREAAISDGCQAIFLGDVG